LQLVDSLGFINEDVTKVKVMEQNITNNHQARYIVNKVYINE